MQAAEAPRILERIILRAARKIGGKYYWRIEFFNDDPRINHADVLRVLRLARENIIAAMIEGDQRRLWRERSVQALRALCSGSLGKACTASWSEQSPTRASGGCDVVPEWPIRRAPSRVA